MYRKTKIICTLGPSTDDPEILKEMIRSGMDVARFNFSHGTYDEHKKRFELLKKCREELGKPIATMLDTRGPEIRVKTFKDKKVAIETGSFFTLTTNEILGTKDKVSITYKKLPQEIKVGTTILVDDGNIQLEVERIEKETDIVCKVIHGGMLSDKKSINIPGVELSQPFISEGDKEDLRFGVELGFDFIAASFSRSAEDIIGIKKILEELDASDINIIAKIENRQGIDNIEEILKEVKGVMVARGDLGVEVPFEEIPGIQKSLIKKTFLSGMPVITATQMLESMMHNPRPTRAETNDVANAIYDGTSVIMLSGETAAGMYPVEAVKTMASIAETTEFDIKRKKVKIITEEDLDHVSLSVTNAISHATVTTAKDLNARAIVTVTKSGQTARMISKYRPEMPIIGCTPEERVYRQLSMVWGVIPLYVKSEKQDSDQLLDSAVEAALEAKMLKNGDLVVITAGVPLGVSGTTNLLKVHVAGDVLVSGQGIGNRSVTSSLCVVKNAADAQEFFREGSILVVPYTTPEMLPIMRKAAGIITEEAGLGSHAAVVGEVLDIPVIVGAAGATRVLKAGIKVTMDAKKGIVRSENFALNTGAKKQLLKE